MRHLLIGFTSAMLCAAIAQAQGASPATVPGAAIQEIEITGERPGPRMWKISRGDHVLWVMGTLQPLPKKMTWRSKEVEKVLTQSEEVLPGRAAFGFSWNPIAALRLYWQWRHIQKSPDRSKLKDELPPALYARVETLRAKYAPHDTQIEDLRPMLVALRLFDKGIDSANLTFHNDVQDNVLKMAKQRGVKVNKMTLKLDDPRGLLKEMGDIPRAAEIGCLETTVTRLETDLGAMKDRAQAWAVGDVDLLRKLPLPDQQAECLAALSNSTRFKELSERVNQVWIESAQQALVTNRSTLALKPVYELLGAHGILERFRALGYTVEGP